MVGHTLLFLHFSDNNVESFNRWMHEQGGVWRTGQERKPAVDTAGFLAGQSKGPVERETEGGLVYRLETFMVVAARPK
jgi:hypothetical protein